MQSSTISEDAQRHTELLFRLLRHLVQKLGVHFTHDTYEQFEAVLSSWSRFRSRGEQPSALCDMPPLDDQSTIAYVSALSAMLASFANEIQKLRCRSTCKGVSCLCSRLEQQLQSLDSLLGQEQRS